MEDFPCLFVCFNISDCDALRTLESFQQAIVLLVQISHDYDILLYNFLNNILLDTSTLSSLLILSNFFGKNVIPILLQTA